MPQLRFQIESGRVLFNLVIVKPGFYLMLATYRSCLLMQKLLRFAGFHRQPSLSLLRGLLYLKVCKSKVVDIFCFQLCLFCGGQKIIFVPCIIHSHRSQHIMAQASHPLSKVYHVQLILRARRLLLQRLVLRVHWFPSYVVVHTANTCIETSL